MKMPLRFASVLLATALLWGAPAPAAEVVTAGDTLVIVPWGTWVVAIAQSSVQVMLPILLPILAGYVIRAISKVYPWAALVLSQKRIEMMLEAAIGYGNNAIQGAAKGKTLSFDVGSKVIAAGTNYVLQTAPRKVIEAAGGAEGIARRVFRKLELDAAANEANTLHPALKLIDNTIPGNVQAGLRMVDR